MHFTHTYTLPIILKQVSKENTFSHHMKYIQIFPFLFYFIFYKILAETQKLISLPTNDLYIPYFEKHIIKHKWFIYVNYKWFVEHALGSIAIIIMRVIIYWAHVKLWENSIQNDNHHKAEHLLHFLNGRVVW